MKFSDAILAVATTLVIVYLVYFVFGIALIPSMGSYWGQSASGGISLLIAGLLVGFAFARKIQEESRVRAVGKIALLLATATIFLVIITFSGNSYYWAYIKESLQNMYSTGAWTTTDWFVYEQLALFMNVALNVSLTLVRCSGSQRRVKNSKKHIMSPLSFLVFSERQLNRSIELEIRSTI